MGTQEAFFYIENKKIVYKWGDEIYPDVTNVGEVLKKRITFGYSTYYPKMSKITYLNVGTNKHQDSCFSYFHASDVSKFIQDFAVARKAKKRTKIALRSS